MARLADRASRPAANAPAPARGRGCVESAFMESWCLWRDRGLLRREAGTREVWAAVGREAGDGPGHEGPPTPAPTRCLCCGGGGGAISGTKTHSGGGEGASQGSDFGTSLVTWREGRVQRRTSLLKV